MLKFISGLVLYFQSGKQHVAPVTEQTRNERLPELLFANIPQCTLKCIYPQALECGCAYSDFQCICSSIGEIAEDEQVEFCITQCPQNEDQRYAPSRILDFCELLGVEVHLPKYMDQFANLHRRQSDLPITYPDASYTDPVYTDPGYSDPGYSDPAYSSQTTSYILNPATVFITSTSSAKPTSTGTNTDTTTPTSTPAPTNTNPSGNSGSGESSSSSSSSSSSGGLSTGAKAGIGIAVPVAVIILVLGIFLFYRRRKAAKNNNQLDSNGGDPKKSVPFGGVEADAGPPPAEADGNPLNEADSGSILPSPESQNQPRTTVPIYELSGKSTAIRPPPPAALAPHRQNESLNRQYSVTSSTSISRKAVESSPTQTESEIEGGRALSSKDPASAVNDAQPSENINNSEQQSSQQKEPETELNAQTSASVEQNDLQQLEEEMAQVRAQRERLQHLQMLEEREEQLKKQIAARKAAAKSTE
ncbi:uncharacterized protein TRUGW13939_10664 [Talaromyces rugulosus]|uniref:CFEM domain-containing protein n=1 Tax=Talaromyces rugulosus TaxID=121627 RepID=A0A7H8RFZ8_TALRU|nr:uncharacterized protein TRUGW13939_10664 [Talaromyces rugulosus]QKX63493.1 hypothetical protein TRUGW13939_10664 [Talaromyces rugulosus]